ncbi:MAG: cytochrome b/b6 domain-containing protein [Gammaproteobacteria bacterium]|nr:cytochrome b/b6 domain-containing protein [Gammaproteobacteria bacterium]MBU1777746.1 cytochrome b/b6 domain-containing protein [Gammaproteobacteria bacterium]MBU1969707.1 cytochrome b/b6 domain-containing protein [Gammaproteobacteria bacterium]
MKQYSKRTAFMHWLIFLLVVAAFFLGHEVEEMQDTTQKLAMYPYHFILGNLVFLLVLVRIYFRKMDGEPAPANANPLLNKLASLTHVLLNLSLIAVAISGFVTVATSGLVDAFKTNDPDLVPDFHEVAAKEFHELFIGVLVLLVAIHVVATLYHQFVVKDNLLRRIMIKRFE